MLKKQVFLLVFCLLGFSSSLSMQQLTRKETPTQSPKISSLQEPPAHHYMLSKTLQEKTHAVNSFPALAQITQTQLKLALYFAEHIHFYIDERDLSCIIPVPLWKKAKHNSPPLQPGKVAWIQELLHHLHTLHDKRNFTAGTHIDTQVEHCLITLNRFLIDIGGLSHPMAIDSLLPPEVFLDCTPLFIPCKTLAEHTAQSIYTIGSTLLTRTWPLTENRYSLLSEYYRLAITEPFQGWPKPLSTTLASIYNHQEDAYANVRRIYNLYDVVTFESGVRTYVEDESEV